MFPIRTYREPTTRQNPDNPPPLKALIQTVGSLFLKTTLHQNNPSHPDLSHACPYLLNDVNGADEEAITLKYSPHPEAQNNIFIYKSEENGSCFHIETGGDLPAEIFTINKFEAELHPFQCLFKTPDGTITLTCQRVITGIPAVLKAIDTAGANNWFGDASVLTTCFRINTIKLTVLRP